MKRLIQQNEAAQTNNDFLQTLKWKLENRYGIKLYSLLLVIQLIVCRYIHTKPELPKLFYNDQP